MKEPISPKLVDLFTYLLMTLKFILKVVHMTLEYDYFYFLYSFCIKSFTNIKIQRNRSKKFLLKLKIKI